MQGLQVQIVKDGRHMYHNEKKNNVNLLVATKTLFMRYSFKDMINVQVQIKNILCTPIKI